MNFSFVIVLTLKMFGGLSSGADNWIIYNKANSDEVFPLWPHLDLAKTCCYDEHREMGATP